MLVALASVKGAPGVTSAALALAGVWPRAVVLLEADPTGGDLAYRCSSALGGSVSANKGVVTLAATVRGGVPATDAVLTHSQLLTGGVRLVQGVRSSGQARGLAGLWPRLAEACAASEVDVILDLGRLDPTSQTLPLAWAADTVLLVAAASLESVMHLQESLPELLSALNQRGAVPVRAVLVGPDPSAEQDCADLDDLFSQTARALLPTVALAHDPRALARLEGGEDPAGRLGRSLLLRRARLIAQTLRPETLRPETLRSEPVRPESLGPDEAAVPSSLLAKESAR